MHAGESSGPEGVRDAIELLGADRIDHGVRAIEDDAVVQLVVDRQIPLGICPSSNLALRVYPTLADHPVERLRRAGVRVSLNTDDPSLLGTDQMPPLVGVSVEFCGEAPVGFWGITATIPATARASRSQFASKARSARS